MTIYEEEETYQSQGRPRRSRTTAAGPGEVRLIPIGLRWPCGCETRGTGTPAHLPACVLWTCIEHRHSFDELPIDDDALGYGDAEYWAVPREFAWGSILCVRSQPDDGLFFLSPVFGSGLGLGRRLRVLRFTAQSELARHGRLNALLHGGRRRDDATFGGDAVGRQGVFPNDEIETVVIEE